MSSTPKSEAKKKRGRPPKAVVESKKAGSRGVRGRPPGDAAAINEFKARLLASPKSRKVMDSILNAALDDDHKNQAAAWKLLMDRMLPLSYFEKDKVGALPRESSSFTALVSNKPPLSSSSPLFLLLALRVLLVHCVSSE